MEQGREKIELIKDRLDIVSVVEKYVKLQQAGKNFSGLCPFHAEKTPSFIVSPDSQRYKCFGCDKSGDIYNFISEIENLDFREALEKLAKQAGVKLEAPKMASKYKNLELLNNKAAEYFYSQLALKKNRFAIDYLKDRGFEAESSKKFSVGYSPGDGTLIEYLTKSQKFSESDLVLSGLFINKNDKIREKFIKRIMFPIRNTSGKIVAFSGRILPGNKYGPKYLNSPETPIFRKREMLYGLHESRQSIRKNDLCIFCEGQTDVISAHTAGLDNIVAPLGTGLTASQLQLVQNYTKNVLFIFDSDLAGQRALERGFILSSEIELNPFAATTDPHTDIDEFIQKSKRKITSLVEEKKDAFSYLLMNKIKGIELSDFANHNMVLDYIKTLLTSVKSSTTRDFYIKRAESMTGMPVARDLNLSPSDREASNVSTSSSDNRKRLKLEEYYLSSILAQGILPVPKHHDIKFFKAPEIIEVLEKIRDEKVKSVKKIVEIYSENEVITKLLDDCLMFESTLFNSNKDNKADPEKLYARILKAQREEDIGKLRSKLGKAEVAGNPKEIKSLLVEIRKLTSELKK